MSCLNPCKHCGKLFGEHWAPYGLCSIGPEVTSENLTRYEPVPTRYCQRCNTLDATPNKDYCSYCLQLSPEDFAKPFSQIEADTLRW